MARNASFAHTFDPFAALANFIAKRIIVRGIRHLVTKIKSLNQSVFAQHSVIKRFANIVPAIVIMNGITTVPHLSEKAVALVQMGAQAFIFLTIALTISELLNIFNLIYQRNPKSRNKPIKGYLQLVKLIIFVVCGLMILGTFLKKDVFTLLAGFGAMAAVLMLVFKIQFCHWSRVYKLPLMTWYVLGTGLKCHRSMLMVMSLIFHCTQ